MSKPNDLLFEKAEDLGWYVHFCQDNSIEFEKWTSAGEDFVFSIEGRDIVREVAEYTYDFDADEHASMWINARERVPGVPKSVRTLIDDADEIQKMLDVLADALREMEEN